MAVEEAIKKRIENLIRQAQFLKQGGQHGIVRDQQQMEECAGWIAAALNVVQLIVPQPDSAYRKRSEEISGRPAGGAINIHVGEFSALLENLLQDIDAGLLTSIADRARAEVFDDFLDHAKAYLKEKRGQAAGVIAGVVFEDSLRRVCRKNAINEKGQQLDALISELVKKQILSQTKAKRARAAAHVRTKATHAQWDEFDLNDVSVTVEFIDEFIASQLDK